MKLEHQLSSLEPSKKLKELGVKQESLFWWYDGELEYHSDSQPSKSTFEQCSAFTVAELGEMLPIGIHTYQRPLDGWGCLSEHQFGKDIIEVEKKMADAMAKMLIYLLEHGLLKDPN